MNTTDKDRVYYDAKEQNFYVLREPGAPPSKHWKSVTHGYLLRSASKTLVVSMKDKKKVEVKLTK
jgi:hypothetical protein